MRVRISLFLVGLVFSIGSCAKTDEGNNGRNSVVIEASTPIEQLPSNSEAEDSLKRPDQTKKSGWQVPPRSGRQITGSRLVAMQTEKGQPANVTSISYLFDPPQSYSEEFENTSGLVKLEMHSAMEYSTNGKVFMYTIFTRKVAAGSNDKSHRPVMMYKILDNDGDGVFETAAVADEETTIPNWVLALMTSNRISPKSRITSSNHQLILIVL